MGDEVLGQEERTPVDEAGRVVVFERDIVPILRENCLECHNESEAKNDYRVDTADEFLAYIESGDLDGSIVYTDYIISEDPDLLMPPASHGGPLDPAELALISTWILEGAHWPDGVTIRAAGTSEETSVTQPPAEVPTSLLGRALSFQGFLHAATVHCPIALLLVGALFVVLSWKWPAIGLQVPMACLILGAASSVAAAAMGWSFAVEEGYGSWTKIDMDSEVFWHRWSGLIVAVLSSVFAIIAIVAVRGDREALNKIWKGGLLVVAGMVGAVGHQGGEMTYGRDFYPKAFRILLGVEEDPSGSEGAELAPGAAESAATDGFPDADSSLSDNGSPSPMRIASVIDNGGQRSFAPLENARPSSGFGN
ncbi:MAG: c-type cytochrome domain-containing protein [Planctomycetota bacterium]